MNILVFIKQVADTEARISVLHDKKSIDIENKHTVNFFDEFAIEEALQIKDKLKESQITVVSYGGKKTIEALRTAIAMGADRGFLISNEGCATEDPLITAKILAVFAQQEHYDLMLCGRQAIDDENAAIGPMIAEMMDIPHVSAITKLDILDDKFAQAQCLVEGGKATVQVKLPALLSTHKDLNTPRVPLITGVMKAMKTQLPEIDPSTLGIRKEDISEEASRLTILSYEAKKQRPPVKIIEGPTPEEKVRKLIAALKEEAKVL